jgi:hypothetical protein
VENAHLAGGKSKKINGNLGDSARGQADPRSVAVYTMDWPGRVICVYVCVGTVFERTQSHRFTCCGHKKMQAAVQTAIHAWCNPIPNRPVTDGKWLL